MLKLDLSNASSFLPEDWLTSRLDALERARTMLAEHNGPGGAFTGWVRLPVDYDREEFSRIQDAARKIRSDSQVLVVIGIGGSYLGARAVIELLGSADHKLSSNAPEIFFAGNGLSTDALADLMDYVSDKDFSINVISKSGTTTEPAVAFRIFKALLEEKYGKEGAKGRIYATTDARKGALKGLADAEGYEEFVVPDAVGGRYSVLTAVGLLPIAAAGIDIEALMAPWRTSHSRGMATSPGSMPPHGTPFMPLANLLNCWWAMSPPSASSLSGGSSSMAKARAKRARASFLPVWSLLPTSIPWASISSRASASCWRRWCVLPRAAGSS